MKQYRFANGFSAKVSAEIVAAELGHIEEALGEVAPAAVVEKAKAAESPLHSFFEWDNDIAAGAWRMSQAQHLIRNVQFREVGEQGAATPWVRCFVSVSRPEGSNGTTAPRMYMTTAKAMANEDTRDDVLRRALNELLAWQEKYQHLKQFASIFEVIDELDAVALVETR